MREAESIVTSINSSLRELYGTDIVTGFPIFRVVWSEDQYEKRHGTYDDFVPGTKIYLRTVTEVREVPKYRQWIHAKHLLERLVLVPEVNQGELPTTKISYEPLWVFQDKDENYMPPKLEACKFIIDTVLSAQSVAKMIITGKESNDRNLRRYVDPEGTPEGHIEVVQKRVDNLVEELYGDESGLMGQTLSRNQGGGQTVIVPTSFPSKES